MLTPDQQHCFSNSPRWRDFRAFFPSVEDALAAYVAACGGLESGQNHTHEIEWRFIYHNRESRRRQLFGLLLLPLGHIQTSHAELRFRTRHVLARREWVRLIAGRCAGSLAYFLCFAALIGAGVGLVISVLLQILNGPSWRMSGAAVGCVVLFALLATGARRTRSLGLSGAARLIAKDAFDLMAVRKVKV